MTQPMTDQRFEELKSAALILGERPTMNAALELMAEIDRLREIVSRHGAGGTYWTPKEPT